MKIRTIGFVFFAIGIPFLIGAVVTTGNTLESQNHSVRVSGMIVDLNGGRPKVAFEFPPGRERMIEGSVSGSNYQIGESLEVLVEKENPENATLGDFASLWFVPLMLFFFSATTGGVGVGILMYLRSQKQKKEFLLRNGEKISAQIEEVEDNHSITVNGRHPCRITAQAQIGSEVYIFKSENLWFNPVEYLDRDEVDVYIAIGNPRKYYMDISFLPKLAN